MGSLIPVFTLVALMACDGMAPVLDAARCDQTYEFGNLGCADVIGTVFDADHHPQPAADVRVLGPAEPLAASTVASATVQSAADGTFRLRVRQISAPPGSTGPDTITVWIRAARPPATVDAIGPSDSTLAHLTIRPVGQVPAVISVPDLLLRAP